MARAAGAPAPGGFAAAGHCAARAGRAADAPRRGPSPAVAALGALDEWLGGDEWLAFRARRVLAQSSVLPSGRSSPGSCFQRPNKPRALDRDRGCATRSATTGGCRRLWPALTWRAGTQRTQLIGPRLGKLAASRATMGRGFLGFGQPRYVYEFVTIRLTRNVPMAH